MKDLYIKSKSLASKEYLPLQLQEILTLVRECKYQVCCIWFPVIMKKLLMYYFVYYFCSVVYVQ